MQIGFQCTEPANFEGDALILPIAVRENATEWSSLDEATGGTLSQALDARAFTGARDDVLTLRTAGDSCFQWLLLAGRGKTCGDNLESWRRTLANGIREARKRGFARIGIALAPAEEAAARAAASVEGTLLGAYRYLEFKAPPPAERDIEHVYIVCTNDYSSVVADAEIISRACCWARDLINTPPAEKRPPDLATIAESMAASTGLEVETLNQQVCAELGMNALLAVAQGSSVGPRVVLLHHRCKDDSEAPIVLVGKGITFDTGGISIKPATSMDEMKSDMSGAAAVLATLKGAAELRLQRSLIGVVPMAENMPGGNAYRPGDIIRAYGGRTIEVLNTDAEGRLILADALAYARERYEPECMVDLATLTGACVTALGTDVAGLMSNDDVLSAELTEAGQRTGDRVWRLPLWNSYKRLIDSPVADVKNTGGRYAGAITAAKFLQGFVGDTTWAHLDIAGPAYVGTWSSKGTPLHPKGGTGFGVRLLLSWLQERTRTQSLDRP